MRFFHKASVCVLPYKFWRGFESKDLLLVVGDTENMNIRERVKGESGDDTSTVLVLGQSSEREWGLGPEPLSG